MKKLLWRNEEVKEIENGMKEAKENRILEERKREKYLNHNPRKREKEDVLSLPPRAQNRHTGIYICTSLMYF